MEEARLNQSAWLESRLNQPGLTARFFEMNFG
jgi:hypothetical protein